MDRLTDALMYALEVAGSSVGKHYPSALLADCHHLLRLLRDKHALGELVEKIANAQDTADTREVVRLLLMHTGVARDQEVSHIANAILIKVSRIASDGARTGLVQHSVTFSPPQKTSRLRLYVRMFMLAQPGLRVEVGAFFGALAGAVLFAFWPQINPFHDFLPSILFPFRDDVLAIPFRLLSGIDGMIVGGLVGGFLGLTSRLFNLIAHHKDKDLSRGSIKSNGIRWSDILLSNEHLVNVEELIRYFDQPERHGHPPSAHRIEERLAPDRGEAVPVSAGPDGKHRNDPGHCGADPSRVILITGHDQTGLPVTSFRSQTRYGLRFRVAAPQADNLAQGDIGVSDIPPAGLHVQWLVVSENVEFLGISPNGTIDPPGASSVARFDLAIPGAGDSAVVTLVIRTPIDIGTLTVLLLVEGEKYRELGVTLDLGTQLDYDSVTTMPAHLNLRTSHEWTTPQEHLGVNVAAGIAFINTIRGSHDHGHDNWSANSANLHNAILNVRQALEEVRVEADKHLSAIPIDDMRERLERGDWKPYGNWERMSSQADTAHEAEMTKLARSPATRKLANAGYRLFDVTFPAGSKLRGIITALEPGSRLDLAWTAHGNSSDWVSHVPWALMYLDPVKMDQPVDCMRFLGLRLRIGSTSWTSQSSSRALGALDQVHALHFLYWGMDAKDDVARESNWQRSAFGQWERNRLVPDLGQDGHRQQVLAALESPSPEPAGILYFYCHCNAQRAHDPLLQFSDTASPADIIKASDLSNENLASGPLVFANACMTAVATSQDTSELEQLFFQRGARGFLGTEAMVPVVLASRFAWLYFQFFLRKVDPAPMAAGEALAQARQFLWTQYRNPGGLFYCLVNQYNLYVASDEEVTHLQRR